MKKAKNILIIIGLFLSVSIHAQQICNTIFTDELLEEYLGFVERWDGHFPDLNNEICVPIHPIVVRSDDGTEYAVDPTSINKFLANVNYNFKDAGLQFYFTEPTYLDSDSLFNVDQSSNNNEFRALTETVAKQNAINVIFSVLFAGVSGTGYRVPPRDWSYLSDRILKISKAQAEQFDPNFDLALNNIPIHEMGHFFGLLHPTNGTSQGNDCVLAEFVARPGSMDSVNCHIAGDFVCDTPADPAFFINDYCIPSPNSFSGDSTDIYGNFYDPLLGNIMHDFGRVRCRQHITQGQLDRVYHGYLERVVEKGYVYDLPPQEVADPSGLILTQEHGSVGLEWNDNADNEFGYLIERSSVSATSGFRAVANGAVNENVISFRDHSISPNQTYFYRVRASNDNCTHSSEVKEITTDDTPCAPETSDNSCENYKIKSFRLYDPLTNINHIISENDEDCEANVNFTEKIRCVDPNALYNVDMTVEINDIILISQHKLKLWGDWNQDGNFDDTELIAESELVDQDILQFEIKDIAFPDLQTNVDYNLRARAALLILSDNYPQEDFGPCDYVRFGQAQDYQLRIDDTDCDPTGTNDLSQENDKYRLYPNPSSGEVMIDVKNEGPENLNIKVFDTKGALVVDVQNQRLNNAQHYLNLEDLEAGIYLFQVEIGGRNYFQKWIKTN